MAQCSSWSLPTWTMSFSTSFGDDTRGSIESGKIADLVLYDGDPFEHTTHVTHTIQEGRVVYDREDYLKLPLARRALPVTSGVGGVGCCMGEW
jgi:adenine deaminase